jgi:hypothetical protein
MSSYSFSITYLVLKEIWYFVIPDAPGEFLRRVEKFMQCQYSLFATAFFFFAFLLFLH